MHKLIAAGFDRLAIVIISIALLGSVAPAGAQTLERIASGGTIKVGYREDAYPFSFLNRAGEPDGYTVEVCRAVIANIKENLGLQELAIDYVPVSTETRFAAIEEGKIDLLCGATTKRLSLRQRIDFSLPIFETGISALMRADAAADIREILADLQPIVPPRVVSKENFSGKRFGARSHTTAAGWLQAVVERHSLNTSLVTVDRHDEGLDLILNGDVDAYFADRAILLSLVAASDRSGDVIVGERLFSNEPYGLAFAKDDENFRLMVDRSLIRLFISREIAAIYGRYFGEADEAVLSGFRGNTVPE